MSIRKRSSKKTKSGYVYEADFYYFEDGIKKRFTKSGFKSKQEARDYITLKQAEVKQNGRLIQEVKKSFKDVYNEFMELGCDQYQHNTIISTKTTFESYIKDSIGNVPITQFDYQFLQKYFNSLADTGYEKNKNIKKAINRILNFAIKMDYIKSNPINLVTVKGVEIVNDKPKVISYEDFNRIVTEFNDIGSFKSKAYAIALQIGFYTGLRLSEVLALDKSDFDFTNDLIYINKKLNYHGLDRYTFYVTHQLKSKSSNAYIPMARVLKSILKDWFNENPYDKVLCDVEGYYINPDSFSNEIRRVAKKLGIYFHYHMLRHTFATTLVTSNVDIKTAQELLRHSNFNTTMTLYTHINDETKKQVINNVFSTKSGEKVANSKNNIILIS